jgi:hypothetical protein
MGKNNLGYTQDFLKQAQEQSVQDNLLSQGKNLA